jgi:glyoxylase-like metal-dependent hydrolase (beta-lactamase superfamily II)
MLNLIRGEADHRKGGSAGRSQAQTDENAHSVLDAAPMSAADREGAHSMSRIMLMLALLMLVSASPPAAFAQATPVAETEAIVTTEFGPVPEAAMGPAIPSAGYLVEEIRDGLYWVTDGAYQAMFLTTGEGVILVDAPASLGAVLSQAIADVTDEAVTHLVYSHHHADHIGGAGQFADATIVAHEDTAALLERSNDPNRPLPTVTFDDSHTLTVGSQTLQLDYHGNNHEPGNIFVYAPAQKVLMVVDIVFPGWVPFADLGLAEDVPGFIAAHDTILGYDFETFIGGHLTRLGTREDVETAQAYVLDVLEHAGDALATVDFMAIGQTVGFDNPWGLFDTYLDAVAAACAEATIPAWQDRLGGVDVFTDGHCWAMMESLRID